MKTTPFTDIHIALGAKMLLLDCPEADDITVTLEDA